MNNAKKCIVGIICKDVRGISREKSIDPIYIFKLLAPTWRNVKKRNEKKIEIVDEDNDLMKYIRNSEIDVFSFV